MADPVPDAEPLGARVPDPDRPPPPPGAWPLASASAPGPATPGGGLSRAPTDGSGPAALPAGPRVGLALATIGVYLSAQLGLQLIVGATLIGTGVLDPTLLDPSAGGATLLALVVASQTVGLALAVLFLRWRGVPLRPIVGRVRPTGRLLGQGAGLGLAAIVASTLVVSLLVALTGSDATPDQVLTGGIADTPLQLLLAVLAAVVLAPLAEELLFRGLLHRGLRRRLGLFPATAVSSVLFAVVHVDVLLSQPLALVGLVVVGAILALAYERTGSLLVPVVIHAVHNMVTIAAVVASDRLDLDLAGSVLGLVRIVA